VRLVPITAGWPKAVYFPSASRFNPYPLTAIPCTPFANPAHLPSLGGGIEGALRVLEGREHSPLDVEDPDGLILGAQAVDLPVHEGEAEGLLLEQPLELPRLVHVLAALVLEGL
jgi:hypothetical protein